MRTAILFLGMMFWAVGSVQAECKVGSYTGKKIIGAPIEDKIEGSPEARTFSELPQFGEKFNWLLYQFKGLAIVRFRHKDDPNDPPTLSGYYAVDDNGLILGFINEMKSKKPTSAYYITFEDAYSESIDDVIWDNVLFVGLEDGFPLVQASTLCGKYRITMVGLCEPLVTATKKFIRFPGNIGHCRYRYEVIADAMSVHKSSDRPKQFDFSTYPWRQ